MTDFCAAVSKTAGIKASTGNIHLENTAVGALKLSTTTGKITVSGVRCQGDLTVGASTGKAELTDITCKSFTSNGTTGNISFDHVIAANGLSVERSTGDVAFDRSDAAELYIKTGTGNVKGSLLSQKVFLTKTSTGDVDVPKTTDGGNCEVKIATGNIKIRIEK